MCKDVFGYIENMPEPARAEFKWLCDELVSLYSKWNIYSLIYYNQDKCDLYHDLGLYLFYYVEKSMGSDFISSICRLTDSLETFSHKNLTLETVINYAKDKQQAELLLNEIKQASIPIRKIRDKRIAHLDYKTRIEPDKLLLSNNIRNQTEKILDLSDKYLNLVAMSYGKCLTFSVTYDNGGVETLFDLIRLGHKYQKYDHMRQYQPDIPPPPL